MGNKSIYERKASSVLGQIDGIGRKAHRFWLAACWGYCLVVFMSGDSQNNALASTSPSPLQHPMAILTRRFFPPESRERRYPHKVGLNSAPPRFCHDLVAVIYLDISTHDVESVVHMSDESMYHITGMILPCPFDRIWFLWGQTRSSH